MLSFPPRPDVTTALLGILWRGDPDPRVLAGWTDEDWEWIVGTVGRHRVGPLLRWRLRGTPAEGLVPQRVREFLEASHRGAAFRALALQAELVRLDDILGRAGIPYVALKGAGLAFDVYPNPALRPMRDLDLLTHREDIVPAYEACVAAGYQEKVRGNLEAVLREGQHLPPLRWPSGNVAVELHHTLASAAATAGVREPLGEDPGFWSRTRPCAIAGVHVPVPSNTDMLLHLLVHATYMHSFDNGPLALMDVILLLRQGGVHWDAFWEMARSGGWERGCALGLHLAERHGHTVTAGWPDGGRPPIPDDVARISVVLTTTTPEHRLDRHLREGLAQAGPGDSLRLLGGKLFPPRHVIVRRHRVSASSLRAFAYYPLHWSRLLFSRVPGYLRSLRADPGGRETAAISRVRGWLEDDGSDS